MRKVMMNAKNVRGYFRGQQAALVKDDPRDELVRDLVRQFMRKSEGDEAERLVAGIDHAKRWELATRFLFVNAIRTVELRQANIGRRSRSARC